MISRSHKRRALIAVAVLVIAAVVLFLLLNNLHQADPGKMAARASFITTCKEQGRLANGGGTALRMDDATEEGLDRYCTCVADHFDQALSPAEIRAVGDGTASQDVLARLNAVMSTCQAEHLVPVPDSNAAPSGAGSSQ
ncbi:MAG TPA: hypothetical protein VM659_18375 [Dongiaceae bacterium]|nr:hypothetical protein [Dongiaceae bacterium]